MSLRYSSGEDVRVGDRVLYFNEPGDIQFVVDAERSEPDDWYLTTYGPGVMIREPKVFGLVYVSDPEEDDKLAFIARHDSDAQME